MAEVLFHKYAAINEAPIYKKKKVPGDRQRAINTILMGTWVGVTQESGDYYFIVTAGPDGWIHKDHVSDSMGLKMFFIDVGQGDGVLIEVGDLRILVDAGPDSNLKNYLTKWQYKYLLEKNEKIHFDYVFISHFDYDHYNGIIDIISDSRFTFGTIYHNGIARFRGEDERPDEYNTDLGIKSGKHPNDFLTTVFDTIQELKALDAKGGFSQTFQYFSNAVQTAYADSRLNNIALGTYKTASIEHTIDQHAFKIEFLGPVVENDEDSNHQFRWFSDSSHTRNGHSLVLKIIYGETSILLSGDLNKLSQQHLINHYDHQNPFESDVVKSCHHGSSDFKVSFLQLMNPYATVISSGDNESYAHPRADAIGASGKYSRGKLPKVFSTELSRSINTAGEILYGMINLRSNGSKIYMAQMKESKKPDLWDSYEVK